MALPDTIKHDSPTSRTTGISDASLSAGGNVLGSAIDNSSNLDQLAGVQVEWACASAPTADKVIEVYLLYSLDGTNYEDGDASTDPKGTPAGTIPAYADTSTHRLMLRGIRLAPHPFKVLLKSELDQSATVTVATETYNPEIVD